MTIKLEHIVQAACEVADVDLMVEASKKKSAKRFLVWGVVRAIAHERMQIRNDKIAAFLGGSANGVSAAGISHKKRSRGGATVNVRGKYITYTQLESLTVERAFEIRDARKAALEQRVYREIKNREEQRPRELFTEAEASEAPACYVTMTGPFVEGGAA